MSNQDEEIIEVIRQGIADLSYDRVEDGILNALRAAGMEVVPTEPIDNRIADCESLKSRLLDNMAGAQQRARLNDELAFLRGLLATHTAREPRADTAPQIKHVPTCNAVLSPRGYPCNCGADTAPDGGD